MTLLEQIDTRGSAGESTTPQPSTLYERALTLAAMGLVEEATRALRTVTAAASDHGPAWQKLAALLRMAGKDDEATAASARAAGLDTQWPPARDGRTEEDITAAEAALRENLVELTSPAERWEALRDHLRNHETDVAALRMLARAERDRGDLLTACDLFERALDLAFDYQGAREDLVLTLSVLGEHGRALAESRRLVLHAPENVTYRAVHADALRSVGDFEAAIPILDGLIQEKPSRARLRCTRARLLHFAGHRETSAREFRAVLEMNPKMGEAWWGLAELRGDMIPADVTIIREHLRDPDLDNGSRALMQFALGRMLEKLGDFGGSFAAYEAGADLARGHVGPGSDPHDAAKETREVRRRSAVFTATTLGRLAAPKPLATVPIFIVGMPRAGSTLVEQILASHSLVEGTMELPVIGNLTREVARSRPLINPDAYPDCVPELSPEQLAELGARYLDEAAVYRRTSRPYFVDKCPWNWLEAGFIRMILPQAKIIDVRREPMAACFAMYKHDLSDIGFPNDFDGIARYYTEYVGLMRHYNDVMPGQIHFIQYERLVEDTEGEIRGLLDYCGLPFEEACQRFWETARTISTPSAEQVRRPIFREALEQWRNFEPWLGPLKLALEAAESDAAVLPQPEGYDLGMTFAAMSVYDEATKSLKAVTRRAPTHPGAWAKLAELLRYAGKDKAADDAVAASIRHAGEASRWRPTTDLRTPVQLEAAKQALQASLAGKSRTQRLASLRNRLAENPADAVGCHLLSNFESEDSDVFTSIALLERTVELAPTYNAARYELTTKLVELREFLRAREQTTVLLRDEPANPAYRAVHAEVLANSGDVPAAMAMMEELVRQFPRHPGFWFRYGTLLRSVGRREESAGAFRTSLDIAPDMGDAYAGLSDLKGSYLTDADVNTIRKHLAEPSLAPSNRMRMYYALGHALERAGDFSASFAAYGAGARLVRGSFLGRGEAYDEEEFAEQVRRIKRFYTARVLSRSAAFSENPVPIFVVGMPRAGSTLMEQILASHSRVEALRELPLMGEIVRDLGAARRMVSRNIYPDCVRDLDPTQLAALGERYIERSRAYRNTDRPWFVDKRPWNWLDAGLIHLILPQAKIIDIRREPMAACFAMFKQQLPKDCAFSYDLRDLGHYYNIYVRLMEHWKSVIPGRIHFVQYERLVEDTENEIRRVLEYCGLPFEENCLHFWETERAVMTPSAEQVRRPIYRDAVEVWRNFEPWLEPLKAALADPVLV